MNKIAMLMLACWLAVTGAAAVAQPVRVDAVEAELVAASDAAVPGTTLMLGLRLRHDPHWHTYWRNPGDSGLPTRFDLTLPDGWKAGEIVWPAPRRIFIGPLANYGFEDEILLPVPVSVPAHAQPGAVRVTARAQWLMCRDVCIPGEVDLVLPLRVASAAAASPSAALFAAAAISGPHEALAARVSVAQGQVSLIFERAQAATAEFFPYEQALVSAPAPQRLYRLEAPDTWRLELSSAEGVDRAAFEKGGFLAGPVGVMTIDGRHYEVIASPGETISGGVLVATAEGEDSASAMPAPASASRFLEGVGVGTAPVPASPAAQGGSGLPLLIAALSGVLGGLILNLMPCVFPVIGLKVLGFAGHAGTGGAHARRGALAFAAGVLASFWLLAALLLAFRGAGQAVGWGFQLQSPVFVAAMALLFVAIGLNFAGLFEFGVGLTRLGGAETAVAGRGGLVGSFGSGVLAVLVATPCTAPFMGSALGYTLGRPAAEVFLVFAALAVGMGLPYVLLGFFPRALTWLPRPGRWMESFRQLLAFPMFATVAWLAWVLGLQAGIDAVLALALGAVLVAFAAWIYGRFVQSASGRHRALASVFAFASLAGGLWLAMPAAGARDAATTSTAGEVSGDASMAGTGRASGDARSVTVWRPWSEAALEQALTSGRPVFVDFTAAWCVSCQVNKKLVLERGQVADAFKRRSVITLRADWTQRDPRITAALAAHGRNGVPLYLLYLPDEAQPRILPEILTPGLVLDALSAAG